MFSARDSQSKHSRAYQFFSGARSFADDLWMVVSRTCVAALALLLIVSLKPLIFDRNFVIGEFVVPDEMKASGLTSSVIARLLYERVARIQRIAKAAVAEQYFDAQPFESHEMRAKLADIKILGAEVNLATLVTQVRALLGITDTQIVGEVALGSREPGKTNYVIRAQASGSSAWTKQPDAVSAHLKRALSGFGAGRCGRGAAPAAWDIRTRVSGGFRGTADAGSSSPLQGGRAVG